MANVNVTYQDMRDAANQLKGGHDDIVDKLTQLQRLVENLLSAGYVTDRSSKQFEQSYQEFTSGSRKTIDGLEGMATYLNNAAQAFEQADEQLARGLNS